MDQAVRQAPDMRLLWTDEADATERLRALSGTNRIGPEEAQDLAFFIDHGWLIWRNAIEPALIDKFVKDIRGAHSVTPANSSPRITETTVRNPNSPTTSRTGSRACSTFTST